MKIKNMVLTILLIVFIGGCGVSQEDYDKLNSDNIKLKNENTELISRNKQLGEKFDECENGSIKIIARIEKANKENNYSNAILNINELYDKFPELPENKKYQELSKKLNENILLEKKEKEREENEKKRLANLNNTGIWKVKFFVDNFGEATNIGYIINSSKIRGVFSNTATQNSELDVDFVISNSNDISIILYEYAGNNPVKGYLSNEYEILMQDKDGQRFSLEAKNYSERLSCNPADSEKIHKALLKGGNIKFRIIGKENPITNYSFNIQNAEWYDNAYEKLKSK